MTIPVPPLPASLSSISPDENEEILRYELMVMASELPDLEKYRAYYDGDQKMVFGTEKFKENFGDAFAGFRDNWCAPVVEAPADKLFVEGISLGTTEDEIEENKDLARSIWNIFRGNDIDEQQASLYEGAFVEGRSYVIAWPDEDPEIAGVDVSLDWNPADLIRVRYADDNPRKIIWAMKRWLSPSGDVYITCYTPSAIYKYTETARELQLDTRTGINAQKPTLSPTVSFQRRVIRGESWPLNNPYNIIPVVEFLNKRESELHDVIPLQDAVNYLMMQGFTAAGYQGFPQRGFFSGVREPVGGWSNEPGRVWQVPPDLDAEGNLHYGQSFQFSAVELSGIKTFVDTVLQHIALQTKTPVRLFFQSDRGGRGDAPSGESLLVDDQPLLDKVEDRQRRFGNSWYRVARLVARMSQTINLDDLPIGEMRWKDPRSKYRSSLIAEGALMVEKMGMPIEFVVTQLGFSEDEIEIFNQALATAKEEQEAKARQEVEAQIEVNAARPAPMPNQPPSNQ